MYNSFGLVAWKQETWNTIYYTVGEGSCYRQAYNRKICMKVVRWIYCDAVKCWYDTTFSNRDTRRASKCKECESTDWDVMWDWSEDFLTLTCLQHEWMHLNSVCTVPSLNSVYTPVKLQRFNVLAQPNCCSAWSFVCCIAQFCSPELGSLIRGCPAAGYRYDACRMF